MSENRKSTYLAYLPEIYRDSDLTGRFLNVFEKILTGIHDDVPLKHEKDGEKHEHPGIEHLLDRIGDYFDAADTPREFLEWLAGWAALELAEDWPESFIRDLIPRIVELYKKRGTKEGLREFLEIYFRSEIFRDNVKDVFIDEWYSPFQVAVTSVVGGTTGLGGGPPGFFTVKVILTKPDIQLKAKAEKVLRSIIDREKPAHAYYRLEMVMPFMQIGVHSTIELDTLLG
jgi:phage tail-like protein